MHHLLAHYNDTAGHHMNGNGILNVYNLIWVLLWLALISLTIIFLFRWLKPDETIKSESPQDIVRKRYAKGEIDENEYKKLLKNLQK